VSPEKVVIRKCSGTEEFRLCVELQKEVWGFSDADLIPIRMFVVAEKVGGQVIGAFDGGSLVGFALSIPGTRNGHPYLHSHMLAVRESYRNSGLGRRLKLAQRDEALQRGFELMEWTFDPLEIKNAYLNIERLGAIARRYTLNQYGNSSSRLQGGLPTDRLVAEWWLNSKRVKQVVAGNSRPEFKPELAIQVPAEIYAWKSSDSERDKAAAVQSRNREEFLKSFSAGLAVLGYKRDQAGNGAFLLGNWDESWSYATDEKTNP
jgi:predicted GNAT superfamily acetyltransferase